MATTMAAAESEEEDGELSSCCEGGGGRPEGHFLSVADTAQMDGNRGYRRPRAEADWWADGRAVNVLIRRHCFRVMRAEEEGRRRHHHYHGIHREIERLWRCSRLRRRMWEAQ